ncbi:hypothetical protein EYF80_032756 [Liparis tanakae]|uniref:Uncharacterized protein n=1 Tax=Liparis tanakae TaxID=230148 RepID=A0A4Z2GVB4_9TELE|nr:hypothetical protein EYF80_032756 [Liparis tanakae]
MPVPCTWTCSCSEAMCLASFSWISCSSIFSSSFMALFSMTFMPLCGRTNTSRDVRGPPPSGPPEDTQGSSAQ